MARRYFPPHKQKRQLMRRYHVIDILPGANQPGYNLCGLSCCNSCANGIMVYCFASSSL